MNQGLELRFVEPSAQAFAEALLALPDAAGALLVGEGGLAQDIAGLCALGGLTLETRPQLPPLAELERVGVLILTELDGERLGDELLACVDLTEVLILAPVTERHSSRMPVFVVSIPKAGTHLAYQLLQVLGYATGVVPPDFPEPQTWYCVEYSNSHTVARDFFVDTVRRSPFGNRHNAVARSPVLFAYRHPLDILVSEAHYYHRPGKTAFAGYFDGDDLEGRVRRLMDDEWLLGSLRQRVGGFLPWLRFPNVIPASFEELVGEAGGGTAAAQRRLLWSILLKLQAGGHVDDIAAKLFNRDSATFREGKIGSHRTQLAPALIEELRRTCGDVISGFGYAPEGEELIPLLAEERAKRPLRFAGQSFDELAFVVEFGFMGCNLMRYAQRFYALPFAAGSCRLEHLSEEQLSRLPNAPTLSALKSLLTVGRAGCDRKLAHLAQAGRSLRDDGPMRKELWYWNEADSPFLGDAYRGFNIVFWQGRFFAIRQSVGEVDLMQDVPTLLARHTSANLMTAPDAEELVQKVDAVLAQEELARRLAQAESRAQALERSGAEAREALASRLAQAEARAQALEQSGAAANAELVDRLAQAESRLRGLEGNFGVRAANALARLFRGGK